MYELQVRNGMLIMCLFEVLSCDLQPCYCPLIVAVESRRGFGGDGSGGTDSGSLFG